MKIVLSTLCVMALAGSAMAQSGSGIQAQAATAGAPLVAVQANPTQFGNSSGTQGSNGGSELNAAWGTISGGRLKLFTTGNLEGNFNKLWFFFDSDASTGVGSLAGGYSDGGFNEINNMTGLTFDSGFTPERGIRLEVGGGFFGVRGFTLNGAPGFDIATGPGIGALPLSNVAGAAGVNLGWDNSNTLGVDGGSAAGALTADSGFAFDIDMAAYFGSLPSEVRVMAFITSGDAGFASNQFLGSLPQGFGNLGNLSQTNLGNFEGNQYFTVVPAPGAFALLGLGGLIAGRRRRA